MGAVAFAVLMFEEAGISTLLLGASLREHFAAYRSTAGTIGLVAQVCFACFPFIQVTRRRRPLRRDRAQGRQIMDEDTRKKILALLDQHRIMTIATIRPDGWPQATTVGYASEGFVLYFLCSPDSQKAANLAHDDRVSLTIDHDTSDLLAITGLSMAARARAVVDPMEVDKVLRMLMQKYPNMASMPVPRPKPENIRIFRVTPTLISILDYSKGFGHADLVSCVGGDIA